MATPDIVPYNKYIGNGATTEFSVSFPYIKPEFVHVYIRRVGYGQEELTADDWSWVNATTIKFPAVGSSQAILGVDDILVVQRETPTENQFEFTNQKRLFPEDVMGADDLEMQILQEQSRELDRALKLQPTSDVDPDELITEVERIYESIDNIDTVADDIDNVNAVAGNRTNIDAVAGNSTNINKVAGNETNINAVAGNESNINAVAGNATNINKVASNETNINAVAGNEANINTVAGDKTNIDAVAGNKANIDTVAGNTANVSTVAQSIQNVNAVGGSIANVNAVAANKTNIDAVAGNSTNINKVANNETNINQVASDTTAINNCSTHMADIEAAPGAASDAADSANTAQIWAEGDDEDVEELGGTHSSLVSAALGYAYANAPFNTPVEEFAASHDVVVNGEKGDTGPEGPEGPEGPPGSDAEVTAANIASALGYTPQAPSTVETLDASDSITLADNTIYNGGTQTALTIALPSTDTIGFICEVDFSSGNTATTLSYSLPDIFWAGVDVSYDATAQKDIFKPVANKRYTIVFYYDGVNYNGRVGGV